MKRMKKGLEKDDLFEIIYMSQSGKITKRVIKVFRFYDKSFLAYCYFRKSFRTFKYKNILALQPKRKKGYPSAS